MLTFPACIELCIHFICLFELGNMVHIHKYSQNKMNICKKRWGTYKMQQLRWRAVLTIMHVCCMGAGAPNSGPAATRALSTVLVVCSRTKAVIAVTLQLMMQIMASRRDWPTASAAATNRSAPSCVKSTTTVNANSSGSVTSYHLEIQYKPILRPPLSCSKSVAVATSG